MSKTMYEVSGDVTVTLTKRMHWMTADELNAEAHTHFWETHDDLLAEYDEGDRKNVRVDNVERVE